MPRVVLLVSTPHGDRELHSENLDAEQAQGWLTKIDTMLGAAKSSIRTDWATVRKDTMIGAYLRDR